MRLTILAAALALAACGNNDESDNTQNVDENLAAESIVANDVTAIDAVTADAANMAGDVDINFTEQQLSNGSSSAGQGQAAKSPKASSTAPRSEPPVASTAPASSPATNATANATE